MKNNTDIYIDQNIVFSTSLPKCLEELMSEVDALCEKGDWVYAMLRLDDIESVSKVLVEAGKITEAEFVKVWKRYGWK